MPTTGKFNAKLFGVYNGSTLISHATEASIEFSGDTIDVTTKDNNDWGDFLLGRKSCTINVSALRAFDATYGADDLFTAFTNNTALTIKFSTEVTGDKYYTGTFYVTSLSENAPDNEGASYSATFTGAGQVTSATVA